MSVFAILALVPLIATCNIRDESLEESLRCRKSAGLVTLWIVFILLTCVLKT